MGGQQPVIPAVTTLSSDWIELAAGNHLPNPSNSLGELLPREEAGRRKRLGWRKEGMERWGEGTLRREEESAF